MQASLDEDTAVDLSAAVTALLQGGTIAYPTEAVYGIGCNPLDENALQRIIEIKGRDKHKGFILIASKLAQLERYLAPIKPAWRSTILGVQPDPVTFVIPAATDIDPLLSGYRQSLAVRVSDHPIVRQLCDDFEGAIVSTSANRSGKPPARNATEVQEALGQDIDVIVRGQTGVLQAPTPIINIVTGERFR